MQEATGRLEEFSAMVESVYDAALEPARWPDAVQRIASLHRCDKALLFTARLAPELGGFAFPVGIDEQYMLDWAARYIGHDLWAKAAEERDFRTGTVIVDTEWVPEEEFLQSVFYREFLVRMDIRRVCSGVVFDFHEGDAPGTFCSVFGGHARQPFDEDSARLHRLTINHLSKALGTMLRLRDTELRLASTLAALDRLHGAVVLLGRQGQVLFANETARRLLAQGDGLALRLGARRGEGLGWLQASRPADQAQLMQQIRSTLAADPLEARHFSHGIAVQRVSGGRPLLVQLAPVSERSPLGQSAEADVGAIAFLSDPEAQLQLDPALLEQLYRLTPAEQRLAREILRGDALPQIAARLAISENTVRTQLKGLFAKTQTRRQADLVKLLMSLAAR
jgi:DNA-binding CsgD family transcriptional regulator